MLSSAVNSIAEGASEGENIIDGLKLLLAVRDEHWHYRLVKYKLNKVCDSRGKQLLCKKLEIVVVLSLLIPV